MDIWLRQTNNNNFKHVVNYLIYDWLLYLLDCNQMFELHMCLSDLLISHGIQTSLIFALCVCRYEVRVEACTALGCSSSDWSPVLTLEAPPAGQTAPLLALQADTHTGLQTTFLLTWAPPAQPNGRVLHYEVYRRLDHTTDINRSDPPTLVYSNISTTCKDEALQPYTVYQYQVQCSVRLIMCVFLHVFLFVLEKESLSKVSCVLNMF